MKKILLLTLAAAAGLSAAAQSKFDLPAGMLVNSELEHLQQQRARSLEPCRMLESNYKPGEKVSVIITLDEGEDAASVLADMDVICSIENMAIVRADATEMLSAAELPQVRNISLGMEAQPLLYQARPSTGVDAIHEGDASLGGSYDGTGVVTGLMDKGLDINHVNFRNDDGTPRASRLWIITGNTSDVATYDTAKKIQNFSTDQSSETHATHVLGIMSGSFSGKYTKVAYVKPNGSIAVSERNPRAFPLYGVAPGADIAAACGTTEGNNIPVAAQLIYDYAKSQNKPAVMNISLGHNSGPHDGSSATNQYLEKLGKDMIICISAGNEGSDPLSIHHNFTSSASTVRTFLSPSAGATSGVVDIWFNDNTVQTVYFQAVDASTGEVKYQYALTDNLKGGSKTITGNYYNYTGYIKDETFNRVFGERGAVQISSNISSSNNRYGVSIYVDLGAGDKSCVPAIVVEGKNGKFVDLYRTNGGFYSRDKAGYTAGNPDGSINDIACGKNVIAVGAYINASKIPSFSGWLSFTDKRKQYDYADFSSYGTLIDGRQLPHISGPGQGMISSYSHYYTSKAAADEISQFDANYAEDKRDNYWGEMSGTSMSSPFVAGVCALWLQANPDLKVQDILNIMKETADNDAMTAAAPERFGYGRINALAGIKKALNMAGIADITVEGEGFIVNIEGRSLRVIASGAKGLSAELYSLNGRLAAASKVSGDEITLDATGCAAGVYVLRATTASGACDTRKIVLK